MGTDWTIGTLLETSSAYWRGCALQAAVRLKLFTHLGEASLDAAAVSEKAETDERATGLLLDALAAMNLLEKQGRYYRNTAFSAAHLCTSSAQYMGHIILHHHHILDGWAQLDTAVATGKAVEKRSYGAEIERESFLMGMFNLAMGIAPTVAREIDLQQCRRLLDLGGGPGTYAIHFCLANPNLQATIFDRPTTRPFAEETIEAYGLKDRITFTGGDFTSDAITGGPYDAAWLSHILHSNDREECQKILAKTTAAMAPGGRILIHDFILDDSKDSPEFAALFSLNMLISNASGRSYSDGEIRSMMERCGIGHIERHPFRGPNDSSILIGIVDYER